MRYTKPIWIRPGHIRIEFQNSVIVSLDMDEYERLKEALDYESPPKARLYQEVWRVEDEIVRQKFVERNFRKLLAKPSKRSKLKKAIKRVAGMSKMEPMQIQIWVDPGDEKSMQRLADYVGYDPNGPSLDETVETFLTDFIEDVMCGEIVHPGLDQ